jgi:hypothetical protein
MSKFYLYCGLLIFGIVKCCYMLVLILSCYMLFVRCQGLGSLTFLDTKVLLDVNVVYVVICYMFTDRCERNTYA